MTDCDELLTYASDLQEKCERLTAERDHFREALEKIEQATEKYGNAEAIAGATWLIASTELNANGDERPEGAAKT